MKLNSLLRGISVGFIIFLILNVGINTTAQLSQVDAYVASMESDVIEEGESIMFTGSIYNLGNISIYLYSMNATFFELLGQSSVRDAKLFDYSKEYPRDSVTLEHNEIYTDNFEANIDLNPGKYNVSVGFGVQNSSLASETTREYRYGLVNQTVEVLGTSQQLNLARGIGYFLLAVTGLLIIYYIYSKFRK